MISCEGIVSIILGNTKHEVLTDSGWNDTSTLALLAGHTVQHWTIASSHTLEIRLSSSAIIQLISEDSPYEDFVIHPDLAVW
jgi:hypothetical protein